MMTMVWVVGRN